MNARPNLLAVPALVALFAVPAAATASTLVGDINTDGTWYTVGAGFVQPSTSEFSVGYAFTLPTDATGNAQLVDLAPLFGSSFTPITDFTWQLDGGPQTAVFSNTTQTLGLIPQGNHTLTFLGKGAAGGIFGFSGQVAFSQLVPLPASWLMLASSLAALGITRKLRNKDLCP